MNPIKSHERSSGVFYDEEIKFFSPLLLANRPFITSSNDSLLFPRFPHPRLYSTPISIAPRTGIITSSHPSVFVPPLITNLITPRRLHSQRFTPPLQHGGVHRFSPGAKFNRTRLSGVIKPKGGGVRPKFERLANVSEKHCERRIWLVRVGGGGAKSVAESRLIQ